MSANNQSLRKLIKAARKGSTPAQEPSVSPAPFGFSTRVAAQWAAGRGRSGLADAWERLCWWGASASVALCVMAFVSQSFEQESNPFDDLIEASADVLEVM